MLNNERDLSYLWDMRKYALEIADIVKGVPHEKFIENKTLRCKHLDKSWSKKNPEKISGFFIILSC